MDNKKQIGFKRLSRLFESRKFWGLQGSGILFQREDGDICLFLRNLDTFQGGSWGIPGGKVDRGEEPRQSAIREVAEEVGGLPVGKFTGKFYVFELPLTSEDYIDGDKGEKRWAEDGEKFEYYTFLYFVEDPSWEPELNWEHDSFKWFDPTDLPPNLLTLKDQNGGVLSPVKTAIENLT